MSATKKKPAAASAEQFEDFAEQATTSMKDGFEKMSKGMTDVSEFSKENIL